MSPPAIVVTLDPQECVLPHIGEVVPRAGVDELLLAGREERLGDCVDAPIVVKRRRRN